MAIATLRLISGTGPRLRATNPRAPFTVNMWPAVKAVTNGSVNAAIAADPEASRAALELGSAALAEAADFASAGALSAEALARSNADTALADAISGKLDTPGATAANVVFAGPAAGAPAAPTFRAIADADIPATLVGDRIHAATTQSTPNDADETGFWSSTSTALRKWTWANIKTALKAYFDTLYAAVGSGGGLTDTTSAATAYTLATSDSGKHIRFTAATLVTVTIDTGSLAANFYCVLRQTGAGQVRVVAGTGTMNTGGTAKTRALYSALSVFGQSGSVGYVDGDQAAS